MKLTQNVVVGLIFFGGLGLLLYFTVIADPEFLGGLFGPKPEPDKVITVRFSNAGGMEKGTHVKAAGMRIGTVSELDYEAETGKVVAQIKLEEKDFILFPGHKFIVKAESPLGGRYVDVEIGDTDREPLRPPLEAHQVSEGRVQADALGELSDLIAENRPDVRRSIENIRKVTEALAEGEGTFGRLLQDEAMYDELMAAVKEFRETIETARTGQGTIAKFLNDPKAYDEIVSMIEKIEQAADSIASVAAKVDRGEGTIGRLINDTVVADDIERLVKNAADAAEKINKGEGLLGVLVNDVEAGKDMKRIASNVADLAERINSGRGTIGKFMTDDRLYDDILATVANFKEMSAKINSGDGTIARLINDKTIYFELRKALRAVTSSIEDAREQAPVSLFTSILFSAF